MAHPVLHSGQTLKAPAGGFQGLVVTARGKHPVPSRTRPLSPAAPMVLRLKTWESRSPPDPMTFSLFIPRKGQKPARRAEATTHKGASRRTNPPAPANQGPEPPRTQLPPRGGAAR